jgi:uncharacterized membrane protein YphA (DoxX/SURF4 family)
MQAQGKEMNKIFAPQVAVRLYGLAAVAFGLVGLSWGDFAAVWQPVPPTVPGRTILAYIVALVLLLAGSSILWRRSAALGALTLTILYSLGVILLHVPLVIAHPTVFVMWSGTAEQLALVAGGLVAYAFCSASPAAAPATATATAPTARIVLCGRLLFGGCLIIFALAHLFYLKPTADFVPAWLPPNQVFWAYATAAGHFLAGVAILSGIAARIAARLLTGMFVVFGLLVHAPTLLSDPHTHFNWAANAMNFALIASAWVIAASIGYVGESQSIMRR